MGEVGFVSGSHNGPLFDLYDDDVWVGALAEADLSRAGVEHASYPTGPAGTITVHNCRTVHGSAPNGSDRARPLLLQTYVPADAFAYTDLVNRSPHGEELIRGEPARWARHDPRPCLIGVRDRARDQSIEARVTHIAAWGRCTIERPDIATSP